MINVFTFGMTIGIFITNCLFYFQMPELIQSKMIISIASVAACVIVNGYFCYMQYKRKGLL